MNINPKITIQDMFVYKIKPDMMISSFILYTEISRMAIFGSVFMLICGKCDQLSQLIMKNLVTFEQ